MSDLGRTTPGDGAVTEAAPKIAVVNPDVELTDSAISALAELLLAVGDGEDPEDGE